MVLLYCPIQHCHHHNLHHPPNFHPSVFVLNKITNQLLDEIRLFDFGVLRNIAIEGAIQKDDVMRAVNPNLNQKCLNGPYVFCSGGLLTFVEYVTVVIRILFYKTHSESNGFKKYHNLLEEDWKGSDSSEGLALLDAIWNAYKLPAACPVERSNVVESSSFLSNILSTPKPVETVLIQIHI